MSNFGLLNKRVHSQEANFSLDNTVTATSLGAYTLPAKGLTKGRTLELEAGGELGTVGAAPGTMTIDLLVGGVAVLTYVSATLTTTLVAEAFFIRAKLTAFASGAAGTVVASMMVQSGDVTLDGAAHETTPQAVDLDTSKAITLRFKWSVADVLNVLDVDQFTVDAN